MKKMGPSTEPEGHCTLAVMVTKMSYCLRDI